MLHGLRQRQWRLDAAPPPASPRPMLRSDGEALPFPLEPLFLQHERSLQVAGHLGAQFGGRGGTHMGPM